MLKRTQHIIKLSYARYSRKERQDIPPPCRCPLTGDQARGQNGGGGGVRAATTRLATFCLRRTPGMAELERSDAERQINILHEEYRSLRDEANSGG